MQKQFSRITVMGFSAALLLGALQHGNAVGQPSLDQAALRSSALAKHNAYRASHHSPAMTGSSALDNSAQSWAEQIAATGMFEHSSGRENVGENLYVSYTTAATVPTDTLASAAVKSWYDEVADYNYGDPGFSSETGHFTQVVWKDSTKLGCGSAQGTATISGTQYNAFYVVCQYTNAGNVTGQFPENVQKP